jgi:hypothetical protein
MNPNRFLLTCRFLLLSIPPIFSAMALELRTTAQNSASKCFMAEENHQLVMKGLCIDIMWAIEKIDPDIRLTGTGQFVPTGRVFL